MNWDARYRELLNSPPKHAGDFYNQSFVDRIKSAEQDINKFASEQDKSEKQRLEARDHYDTFKGQMQDFSTIHKNAYNEFGVKNAFDQYDKSKQAIAMTELAMDALPSSIVANSNVVLTQAQREARYNVASQAINRQREMLTQGQKMYEDAWQNARKQSLIKTQAVYQGEWDKLQDFNNAWISATNDFTHAQHLTTMSKLQHNALKNDYLVWQHGQYSMAQARWLTELNSAFQKSLIDMREQWANREREIQREYLKGQGDIQKKYAYWHHRRTGSVG